VIEDSPRRTRRTGGLVVRARFDANQLGDTAATRTVAPGRGVSVLTQRRRDAEMPSRARSSAVSRAGRGVSGGALGLPRLRSGSSGERDGQPLRTEVGGIPGSPRARFDFRTEVARIGGSGRVRFTFRTKLEGISGSAVLRFNGRSPNGTIGSHRGSAPRRPLCVPASLRDPAEAPGSGGRVRHLRVLRDLRGSIRRGSEAP
jgi:hypothetical protein